MAAAELSISFQGSSAGVRMVRGSAGDVCSYSRGQNDTHDEECTKSRAHSDGTASVTAQGKSEFYHQIVVWDWTIKKIFKRKHNDDVCRQAFVFQGFLLYPSKGFGVFLINIVSKY